jgi:hypothetical protein
MIRFLTKKNKESTFVLLFLILAHRAGNGASCGLDATDGQRSGTSE